MLIPTEVELREVLENACLSDVVDFYGFKNLLEFIGAENCVKYFGNELADLIDEQSDNQE